MFLNRKKKWFLNQTKEIRLNTKALRNVNIIVSDRDKEVAKKLLSLISNEINRSSGYKIESSEIAIEQTTEGDTFIIKLSK